MFKKCIFIYLRQESLYQFAEKTRDIVQKVNMLPSASRAAEPVWKAHNNYMVPWVRSDDIDSLDSTVVLKKYPEDCYAA